MIASSRQTLVASTGTASFLERPRQVSANSEDPTKKPKKVWLERRRMYWSTIWLVSAAELCCTASSRIEKVIELIVTRLVATVDISCDGPAPYRR